MNKQYLWGMLPCCRPQQLRCFGLRDSFLPLPRVSLLTQLHHVATGPSPRYHGALKFGSLRSQHHIKLPDKSEFVEQQARVSERNSGAPAKGRKNIGRGKRATRALPLLKTKK